MNWKKIIKEETDEFEWMRNIEVPKIDGDTKYYVLVELLGYFEVFGDGDIEDSSFEELGWDYWGLTSYHLDNGEEWAVGTVEEFDQALYDYWRNYPDEVGFENVYGVEDYLIMSYMDRRLFAQDMSDSWVNDLSDEEVIERAGLDTEYEELTEELNELELEDDPDYDAVRQVNNKIDDLVYNAKETVREEYHDTWFECLDDPYKCLVLEHGLYSDLSDLITHSHLVDFDYVKFAEDESADKDYSVLSGYDGNYFEHEGYMAIRIG